MVDSQSVSVLTGQLLRMILLLFQQIILIPLFVDCLYTQQRLLVYTRYARTGSAAAVVYCCTATAVPGMI